MRETVQRMLQLWKEAAERKDVDTIMTMVTEDAVFLAPGMGKVEGIEAVGLLYRNLMAKFDIFQNFDIEEIGVSGDMAYVRGIDSATMTPVNGEKPMGYRGYGMMVLRKQADGTWKFARGINAMSPVNDEV